MKWSIVTLYPEEMMEPFGITKKSFPLGTIAGSLGQKKNINKKPGINEDGGLIAYNDRFIIGMLADGHYARDTTELLIDELKNELLINKTKWHFSGLDPDNENLNPKIYSMTISQRFFDLCKNYVKSIVTKIRIKQYKGEASFTIMMYDKFKEELHYYHVGDLIFFMSNPQRKWGPAFQVVGRQFYEWINHMGVMGYHHGFIRTHPGSRLILATDGLIDKPTFSMKEIEEMFELNPFDAETYVKYGLEHNTDQDDDNVTVICLDLPHLNVNELAK